MLIYIIWFCYFFKYVQYTYIIDFVLKKPNNNKENTKVVNACIVYHICMKEMSVVFFRQFSSIFILFYLFYNFSKALFSPSLS